MIVKYGIKSTNLNFSSNKIQYKKDGLLELDIDPFVKEKVDELSDIEYQRFLMCLNRKVNAYQSYLFSKYDDKKFARLIELFDKGIDDYNASDAVEFDDFRYERYIKLIDAGFGFFHSHFLSKNEEMYNYALCFTDYNFKPDQIYQAIVKSSFEECSRLQKLVENGLKLDIASKFTKDDLEYSKKIEEIKKEDEKLENEFSKIEKFNPDEITPSDRRFLAKYAFDNKTYSASEYIQNFLYFKKFKSSNGTTIFNAGCFYDKSKIATPQRQKGNNQTDTLYCNVSHLLNLSQDSVETSYFEMFFDLIKSGYINSGAIRKMNDDNFKLSDNLKRDLDLFYEDALNNNIERLKNNYIKTFGSDVEALSNIEIGDCYILEGDKYIKIKTDENKSEQLQISKDTYFTLFSPIERFASSQQVLGDCYLIETVMSLYDNPKSRFHLLNLIKEDTNGNITIQNSIKPITFSPDDIEKVKKQPEFSSGALGYILFEDMFGQVKQEEIVQYLRQNLSKEKLEEFEKLYNLNKDDIYVYEMYGDTCITTFKKAKEDNLFMGNSIDKIFTGQIYPYGNYHLYLLGNGGQPSNVLDVLGFKNVVYINNFPEGNDFRKAALETNVGENKIHLFDEIKDEFYKDDFFSNHVVLYSRNLHIWGLNRTKDKNGNYIYQIFNPHNQAIATITDDIDDIIKNMKSMSIVSVD